MLHEEVEKYINLSGDKEAWQNISVSRIGGYLDGYDRGLEVLGKIRAEIQENINYNKKMNYQGIVAGLLLTLDIIDKCKAETEDT